MSPPARLKLGGVLELTTKEPHGSLCSSGAHQGPPSVPRPHGAGPKSRESLRITSMLRARAACYCDKTQPGLTKGPAYYSHRAHTLHGHSVHTHTHRHTHTEAYARLGGRDWRQWEANVSTQGMTTRKMPPRPVASTELSFPECPSWDPHVKG